MSNPANSGALTQKVIHLLNNPHDTEEFTATFSLDENWNALDLKSITVPRSTAVWEGECPHCDGTLRAIYPKFYDSSLTFSLPCPHCEEDCFFRVEFAGWTAEMTVDAFA